MKVNIPPFHLGQKVVYITGKSMPKGSVHTVTEMYLPPCGCRYIIGINGVPIKFKSFVADIVRCAACGLELPASRYHGLYDDGGWNQNSFRPLQESKMPLIKLSQIKETEKEQVLIEN